MTGWFAVARPNIVFITSDQQRSDCYGFAGKPVKTPHLDKLRAEGMHFSSCITPAPVCQPARAAILTGKLPKTNGVKDNGIDLRPEVGGPVSLAALLAVLTDITGAVLATPLFNAFGFSDWRGRGFAVGVTCHGIGTAHAFQISPVAGSFAALNALFSALILPALYLASLG